MTTPNRRERELAELHGDNVAPEHLLAGYREEILKPFEELRVDYESLGDERVAKHLDELLKIVRGAP